MGMLYMYICLCRRLHF